MRSHTAKSDLLDTLVRLAREAGIRPEDLSEMTLREFSLRVENAKTLRELMGPDAPAKGRP